MSKTSGRGREKEKDEAGGEEVYIMRNAPSWEGKHPTTDPQAGKLGVRWELRPAGE